MNPVPRLLGHKSGLAIAARPLVLFDHPIDRAIAFFLATTVALRWTGS